MHNFVGDKHDRDAEVFWPIQGCVQIEICDVHGAELGIRGGDNAVKENFGGFQLCSVGALVSWVVDVLAAHSHSCLIFFGFCGHPKHTKQGYVASLSCGISC
jgi:hypothetical protein